jgi:hypothetical protein
MTRAEAAHMFMAWRETNSVCVLWPTWVPMPEKMAV